MHALEILYRFYFAGKHRFVPAFEIVRDKRKGSARSRITYDLTLNYVLDNEKITLIANTRIGYAQYDGTNPAYNVRQNDMRYAATGAFYVINPMGWRMIGEKPFRFAFTVAYNYIDANIEFYQQRGILAQVGVITQW